MQIPEETINLIRERCRIEDVVIRYVPSLVKKGRNYIGLCPFHKEKTPSFVVSPEKQIFNCFGCNFGGNIFSFIQKIENVSFPESVIIAGEIAGITVQKNENRETADKFSNMFRINQYAARLYHKYLLSQEGETAYKYLIARGVTDASMEEFQLGFAPDLWDFLLKKLSKKNVPVKSAALCGLIAESRKKPGTFFDQFRNRIMFPINDVAGRVIAFGGRVIGNEQPKYLNSQETPVFHKRSVLYGFDKAKAEIVELKRAIIVEGYLDVIGCHQNGIKNVVAPLGTALTEQQIRLLSRYCTEIVLLFDADLAGINAALKTIDLVKDVNVDIKVATLPESDPFEYIMQKGIREFMMIVDQAENPVDFKIKQITANLDIKKPLKQGFMQLFDIIKTLELESDRSIYLKKISSILNIDENSVRLDFNNYLKKNSLPLFASEHKKDVEKNDFLQIGYTSLIALLCNYPHFIEKTLMDFSLNEVSDPASKNILLKMSELYSAEENLNINKLFDILENEIELSLLNNLLHEGSKIENPDVAYEEIYLNMELHKIDTKINKYADLIKASPAAQHEYLTEIEILRRDREKLSQYVYNRKK